jgi:hypothetical protein
MSNTQIDDSRAVELASKGHSNVQIADVLGCDEASVRRALRRQGFKRHLLPVDLDTRFHVQLDTPIVISNQDVMITADWHVPVYNPTLVNSMIERARVLGLKHLIMAGDFWNFDSLSQYDPKQDSAGLEREWKEGIAVMRVLAETFEHIYFVWGNHDARFHKALGHATAFATSMKMVFGAAGDDVLSRMTFTNLDHLWVGYGDEDSDDPNAFDPLRRWYICHPISYSSLPLSGSRALAAKYQANVITAHSHHAAVGFAVDGKFVAAEAGGLFDANKTAYLQRSTKFPRWQNGYAYLVGERLQLVTDRFGT